MISEPLAVFFILAAVVSIAIKLQDRSRVLRALGPALTAILIGMLLSNVGLIPGESPTYQFLMGTGVNCGLALILLSVDLRSILLAGPRMLAAFGIGAVGTALGAIAGASLCSAIQLPAVRSAQLHVLLTPPTQVHDRGSGVGGGWGPGWIVSCSGGLHV